MEVGCLGTWGHNTTEANRPVDGLCYMCSRIGANGNLQRA